MQNENYLVVDVNVVISALIKKGIISEFFSINYVFQNFRLIAPEFFVTEISNNREKVKGLTKYSEEEFEYVWNFIMNQITVISEKEHFHKEKEARSLLKGHEKDSPYLALALAFNCKILSGDKALKSIISDRVISPDEVLRGF